MTLILRERPASSKVIRTVGTLCCDFCLFADRYGVKGDRKDKPGMSKEEFDDLPNQDKETLIEILVNCGLKRQRLKQFDKEPLQELITSLRGFQKECFAKLFGKHMGRTGGTLDCICSHLCQYAIKFNARAESPRDPAAMLAWFKHVPHCACYDFWCGGCDVLQQELARVGVNLGARKGALVEESKYDSIKHLLPVSVPELAMECAPSKSFADAVQSHPSAIVTDVDRPPHIVTNAKSCFALHDDFHGSPHTNCLARKTGNFVQLRSVNTSRQEHHNRVRLLHDPFLRNQVIQRNMFLHLVIAHCRNLAINEETIDRLQSQLKDTKLECPEFEWKLRFNKETGRIEIVCD